MQKEFQIRVNPEVAASSSAIITVISRKFGIPKGDIRHVEILRRSIDARKREVMINLKVLVFVNEDFEEINVELPDYQSPKSRNIFENYQLVLVLERHAEITDSLDVLIREIRIIQYFFLTY